MRLLGDQRGVSAIEYGLLLAGILLAAAAGYRLLGKSNARATEVAEATFHGDTSWNSGNGSAGGNGAAGAGNGSGTTGGGDSLAGGGGGGADVVCDGRSCDKPGGGCFVAGTLVATPSGARPIESLRVGDLVLARSEFDDAVTARPIATTYIRNGSSLVDVQIVAVDSARETVRSTPDHLYFTLDLGWVAAADLVAGETLLDTAGHEVRVGKVVPIAQEAPVYNFEVDVAHTYFVGHTAVWVHNPDGCGPGQPFYTGPITDPYGPYANAGAGPSNYGGGGYIQGGPPGGYPPSAYGGGGYGGGPPPSGWGQAPPPAWAQQAPPAGWGQQTPGPGWGQTPPPSWAQQSPPGGYGGYPGYGGNSAYGSNPGYGPAYGPVSLPPAVGWGPSDGFAPEPDHAHDTNFEGLTDDEGQVIIDGVQWEVLGTEGRQTTSVTSSLSLTADGRIILTASGVNNRTTTQQRQRVRDALARLGYSQQVIDQGLIIPDAPGGNGFIPGNNAGRIHPYAPGGSGHHGEGKGIWAANRLGTYVTTQWSASGAKHTGLACPTCQVMQEGGNPSINSGMPIYNPTGSQAPRPGRGGRR